MKEETRKLQERKKKLLEAIEFTKQKKKQVTGIVQKLTNKLASRTITRHQYEEELKHALKSRTAEQWAKYYEDYLAYYNYQIKLCDKLIKQEKYGKIKEKIRQKAVPALKISIIIITIALMFSLIFILKPIGMNVFTKIGEKVSTTINQVIEKAPEEITTTPTTTPTATEFVEPIVPVNLEDKTVKISGEELTQYQAVVGKPVKWKKQFITDSVTGFVVELPKGSENISVKSQGRDIIDIAGISKKRTFFIFGEKAVEVKLSTNSITGMAIGDETNNQESVSYEVEYETSAPTIQEEEINNSQTIKRILINGPDEVHYKNILSFTELPNELNENELKKLKLYQIKNGNREDVKFTAYDTNENGLYDYIEWVIPELSSAEFLLIIEISKAEHLDVNRENGKDIYEQVKALDDIWSETINENEYVRVTFEVPLDNTRDITLYPRVVSGNPKIEVYEVDSDILIAEFDNLVEGKNTIYLTNLTECYDNKTEILTENGWKYFFELKDEKVATLNQETKEVEWQEPTAKQNYNYNGEMYKIETEDAEGRNGELVVSPEHKVYASFNNLSISSSDNTLINSCFFNPNSLDQIEDLSKYNDSANNGKSLKWGDNFLASEIYDLYSDLGMNLTILFINKSKNSNSELESSEDFIICFFKPLISKNTKSGETNLYPICLNSLVSRNTLDLLKKESKIFVSNISNIFYSCNSATLSFTHSENSFASLSESLDLEAIFSPISNNSSSSISSCRALSIALLTNLSNCKFFETDNISLSNSSGILIQTSAILTDNIENQDYLSFSVQKNLSQFSLQKVTDVYKDINENNKDVYFLDENNKPVKVKSITKENYKGKIYDVDVENDIVLVRRKSKITEASQTINAQTFNLDIDNVNKDLMQDKESEANKSYIGGEEDIDYGIWSGNSNTQDVFDLKVVGGSLELDWIVDPIVALNFHSGFETGDLSEWSVTSSPSIQSNIKKTGSYAMRVNSAGSITSVRSGKDIRRATFYLYISSAPNSDAFILKSQATQTGVVLTSDRYLKLMDTGVAKDTGSTQLNIGEWYRISISIDNINTNVKIYLNGAEECFTSGFGQNALSDPDFGVGNYVNADLYFDDYASDFISSAEDLGDIRVQVALPISNGITNNYDITSGYMYVDNLVSAGDGDYVEMQGNPGAMRYELFNLPNMSDMGISGATTPLAVNVITRQKRGGGSATTHYISVYSNNYYNTPKTLDTSFTQNNQYYTEKPETGAWNESAWDNFQVGVGHSGGGQDQQCSAVNVMLAYVFNLVVSQPKTYDNNTKLEKVTFFSRDGMFINVSVTHLNGASSIDRVLISILNSTGGVVVPNASMNRGASITNGYVYNYSWQVPSNAYSGQWVIVVYANDTNNYWVSSNTSFIVNASAGIKLINPQEGTGEVSIFGNNLFNVTLNVSCILGNCGVLNVTLFEHVPGPLEGTEDTSQWNKTFSSSGNYEDPANSVAVDSQDNVYVVGSGHDLVSSSSGYDWLIKKFNSNGVEDTTNWNKTFNWYNYEGLQVTANSVAVDSQDNVYVVGAERSATTFYWVIKKFNSNGVEDTTNWNKTFFSSSSSPSNIPSSVAVDSQDNVYVVGQYQTTQGLIKKFNSNGVEDTTNWNKTFIFGLPSFVAVDSQNNVYVVGQDQGLDRGVIKKFNSNGVEDTTNWNKLIASGTGGSLDSIEFDSQDNVYITGGYGANLWLIKKFNSNGVEDTTNWNKIFASGNGESAKSVKVDEYDKVYVAGQLNGKGLIKKFNSNGVEDTTNWNKTLTFPRDDSNSAKAVAINDRLSQIYVVGSGNRIVSSTSGMDWWMKSFSLRSLNPVPINIGATPFKADNNPIQTSSLSQGSSQTIIFWVNATGDADTVRTFLSQVSISGLGILNATGSWNVRILAPPDLIPPLINFTSPTPENGNVTYNIFVPINVTANDSGRGNGNVSVFIDFNRSLVGWWRMDDIQGTTVYDNSTYGNTGTIFGAVQSDGKLGKAMEFDGVNDYIDIGNDDSLNIINEITISTWININDISRYPTIVQKGSPGTGAMFEIQLGDMNTKPLFGLHLDGSKVVNLSSTNLNLHQWYHIAGTYDGSNMKIYIDGINNPSDIFPHQGFIDNSSIALGIGGNVNTQEYNFNGSIDDVMIFNRALSQEEIYGLYANSSSKYLFNNFTDLENGDYTFKAYAQDTAGNVNETEERNVSMKSTKLYSCGILDTANTVYTLQNNLATTGTCLTVSANNITIDLNGFTIDGDNGAGDKGMQISEYNNTKIINGWIKEFGIGINTTGYNGNFTNLTISSSGNEMSGNYYGIYSTGGSNYISKDNLSILYYGEFGIVYGIYLAGDGNVIEDTTSVADWSLGGGGGASSYGIYLTGSSNNIARNSNFTADIDLNYNLDYAVYLTGNSINNTFLNTSQRGGSAIYEEYVSGGSSLIRKWYYQANVTDASGLAVANANLSAYNVTGMPNGWQFNLTSNSTGWTNITTIIDYVNTNNIRTYYSNYTINTTNGTLSESHKLNVTAKSLEGGFGGMILDNIDMGTGGVLDFLAPLINFTPPTSANGSVTPNNFIPVNVTADDTGRGDGNVSVFIDFNRSLVGWWRLQDNIYDDTGINNGTGNILRGNPVYVDGKLGKALSFDGVDDSFKINSTNNLRNDKGSLGFWFNRKNYGGYDESSSPDSLNYLFAHFNISATVPNVVLSSRFYIGFNASGKTLYTYIQDDMPGGYRQNIDPIGEIEFNEWHYLVVTWENGISKTYFDGNLNLTSSYSLSNFSWAGRMFLGAHDSSDSGGGVLEEFNGSLDDVMIFNRALSQEEIYGLYANSSSKYLFNNFTDLENGDYTFKAYAQDLAGNVNWTETREVMVNASLAPQIIWVQNISNATLLSGGVKNVSFNFIVYDASGYGDLNDSSARANFTKAEYSAVRENLTCSRTTQWDNNYANYACTIGMWYYDEGGAWNISVAIKDNSGLLALNDSTYFSLKYLYSFDIVPNYINWSNIQMGSINQSSDNNMTIRNLGNVNIINVTVNATNLNGTGSYPQDQIPAANFSFSNSSFDACSGNNLIENQNVSINLFINYSKSSYTPANSSIGFCLKELPVNIHPQEYKTPSGKEWWIDVVFGFFISVSKYGLLMVAVVVRKKKKTKKTLTHKELFALDLILKKKYRTNIDSLLREAEEKEIREKYEIKIPIVVFKNRLSPAEALCKYLKENLEMRYSEISKLINRDERTVWINYRNSVKKMKEKLIIEKTKDKLLMDINIVSNRRLSILESIVKYLKEKGYRNVEIAQLLGKDQRNIYTLYNRAVKN